MEREWPAVAPLRLTADSSRSVPFFTPTPGEATVWRFLCPPALSVPPCAVTLLDDAERAQAARFLREEDRRLFLFSHAVQRRVLAAATGLDPRELTYARTPQGKPYLPNGPHISLSHAGDCVLVAVCADHPVGVDVECVRELPEAEGLVERFFAAEERQAYRACPPADRLRAFFTLWTRKEAYSKALGHGLAIPLNDFAVSLSPPPRILRPWVDADGPAPRLWDVPAPDGYVATLAGWARRVRLGDVLP